MGRYADIWHSYEPLDEFRRKNDIVKRLADDAGRDESRIERAIGWEGAAAADAYYKEGVTLFTAEIKSTDDGYNLDIVKEMIAWRDGQT